MMAHIFLTTIVPILLLVLVGYGMDRKFHLDLDTLSKINFYVVAPAFLFTNTYKYHIYGGKHADYLAHHYWLCGHVDCVGHHRAAHGL